jgi:hypothetical protein
VPSDPADDVNDRLETVGAVVSAGGATVTEMDFGDPVRVL